MNAQHSPAQQALITRLKEIGLVTHERTEHHVRPAFWLLLMPFFQIRSSWHIGKLVSVQVRLQDGNKGRHEHDRIQRPVAFIAARSMLDTMIASDVVLGVQWPLLLLSRGRVFHCTRKESIWTETELDNAALFALLEENKYKTP